MAAAAAQTSKQTAKLMSGRARASPSVEEARDGARRGSKRRGQPIEEPSSKKKKKKEESAAPESPTTRPDPVSNKSPAPEKSESPKSTSEAKKLSERKWTAWSQHAHSSPFPDFNHPTPEECKKTHDILESLHGDRIRQEWADPDAPAQEYPYVMNALVVAALSQATSGANAKRAMKNMKSVYGSTFAYEAIVQGGIDKLRDALRPGGMQNHKSKILMDLLAEVKARYGKWDLQHLFNATDEEAVKEVISYKGLGPKCAYCLLSICLKRDKFAVDTHIYRISGLWGWRPSVASPEKTQAHLDARIPNELKFALHYHLIAHGQTCPMCRGNGNRSATCEFRRLYNKS